MSNRPRENFTKSPYAVNQLWSLKNSKNSDCTYAHIFKIETLNSETIIHISILNNHRQVMIDHLPFSKTSFAKDLQKLVSNDLTFLSDTEGYDYWRTEYDNGKAGVYGIGIVEAVNL